MPSPAVEEALRLSPHITMLPIVHANGDMAQEVRETLTAGRYDCLAVPLSPSLQDAVEAAVSALPFVSVVTVRENETEANYVPIDPCQPVIMSIRVATAEGVDRAYLDRDVRSYEPDPTHAPDPYLLKSVSAAAYAAASLTVLAPPAEGSQRESRIAWIAFRLHELELDYHDILCLCPVQDWPYVRDAYRERKSYMPEEPGVSAPQTFGVTEASLYFVLGELPFITALYEQRRAQARSDRHLSIDGVKELLLETRSRWTAERKEHDWMSPHRLQIFLKYVRNLALLDRRLTPDLYTLVTAAQQIGGDGFAVTLIETAKDYRGVAVLSREEWSGTSLESLSFGLEEAELPDGARVRMKNRLPGPPRAWRTLHLRPKPTPMKRKDWAQRWNPLGQCSWPPEDARIESFNLHVREQAKALLGADLARTEKFTTSIRDGIDLRETLRHWHKKELYVKEIPPTRGNIEVVVFLFDTPADPGKYSWRATWFAEHREESTLCFYATPFGENLVGPGIGEAVYGGAMFLFPPRPILDIWSDPRLAFAGTMEERLLAGALMHSREPHIVVVSPVLPTSRWRRLARTFHKRLIPIPLSRFSRQTVDRLRRFHVLNGHDVRSYAARFIQEL